MNEKRILHAIPTLRSGGAEKLINDSLPEIKKRGYVVDLYVINIEGSFFVDKLKKENINIYYGKNKNIKSYQNFIELFKLVKKNDYHIIHGHLFPVNYWLSLISLCNKNTKYIFTEHNTHNRRRNYKFLKPLEKLIYSRFSKVIAISDMTQENLMEWLEDENKRRFPIVYNGINIDDYSKAHSYMKTELSSKISQDDTLLLMVGSFTEQKDQDTIIKSLSLLPSNIKLLLVGEGVRREILGDLVKEYKLEDRVVFLGLRNDVPRINKTVDIIIVSSHWEGFGLVAAEGMAAKKPMLVSNVPGLREVVCGAGILFEKGSHKELANIIKNLYNNDEQCQEYSNLSFEKSKEYNIDYMSQEIIKIYENL